MRSKPEICRECPLYGNGKGFVPDVTDKTDTVLIVSMYPSTYEVSTGEPRAGMTIAEYTGEYEKYAGDSDIFSYTHLVRCRGVGNRLPSGKTQKDAVKHCRNHDNFHETYSIVVHLGEDVGRQLRPDLGDVVDWRGFILPEKEVTDVS